MTIEPFNVRAALWAILAERTQALWQIPDDPLDWHEWVNPFLPPRVYDIPPIPDEPPELRARYTPDDALPVDLLRYRTDPTRRVRV